MLFAQEFEISDIVILIGVITTSIISIIGAVYGRDTKKELKTANSRTIGQQVDANTSARYVMIPVAERTELQVRHLLDVPPDPIPVPKVAPEGNPPQQQEHSNDGREEAQPQAEAGGSDT